MRELRSQADISEVVQELLDALAGQSVRLDIPFVDIALDSLDQLQFVDLLEKRLGLTVRIADLYSAPTTNRFIESIVDGE